jgi:hypothetical protein
VQSLKKIQIRPEYSGTLESLAQEFLKACQYASKTVLIRVPLPGISNWKYLLETLIASSDLKISLVFEIPNDKLSLSPEIIISATQDIAAKGNSVFNTLLLKILNSATQITFDSISHSENDRASRCALIISDSTGETVNFQISSGNGNDVLMSADWSWGDPNYVAEKELENFEKAWTQGLEKGFNVSNLRQALREIVFRDAKQSIQS